MAANIFYEIEKSKTAQSENLMAEPLHHLHPLQTKNFLVPRS